MKTSIKLTTVSEIKEFVTEMQKFMSDINIIKGHYVIDAKSILGLFSIDATKGVEVEIISKDTDEIMKFSEVIERWI